MVDSCTGWGGQSWTKMFFFQYLGLHVLSTIMLGLKSTGWCGLAPWLTIYSILTPFSLATAQQRRRQNERQVLLKCTATSRSQSAATDGRTIGPLN
jgi:hypothetical protein